MLRSFSLVIQRTFALTAYVVHSYFACIVSPKGTNGRMIIL